jgi:hypothetical protein
VLNAGISGNRVLGDGAGVSALARFDRDVLMQTGVTHVVVMEGINDIGIARNNPSPSAADLIAGHKQLIERAHARGLKIYGATLTPYEGAGYFSPEGEAKRQALNQWIRTSGAYDGVIDFDMVTRDPAAPTKFLPAYDSGDHLHPGDAGSTEDHGRRSRSGVVRWGIVLCPLGLLLGPSGSLVRPWSFVLGPSEDQGPMEFHRDLGRTQDQGRTKHEGPRTKDRLGFDQLLVGLVLVEELEGEAQDLVGELVGLQVAELLFEGANRHDGLRHGAMAAGAADVVEVLAHELTGVPRIAQIPHRDDQRVVDDP